MNLLDLPVCMISNIFSYLTYDEIAKNRAVCKTFDEIGREELTRGFAVVQRRRFAYLRELRAQLPRRESERRSHPLNRHNDILWSMDTRLAILSSAFQGWIEKGYCCFIPGKIIDEVIRLIRILKTTKEELPSPHRFLLELRDLCCMAVEYFREHITPDYFNRPNLSTRYAGESVYETINKIKKNVYKQEFIQRLLLQRCKKLNDDMLAGLKISKEQSRRIVSLKEKVAVLKSKLAKYQQMEQFDNAHARPTIIKRRNPVVFSNPKRPRTDFLPVVDYIQHLVDTHGRYDKEEMRNASPE